MDYGLDGRKIFFMLNFSPQLTAAARNYAYVYIHLDLAKRNIAVGEHHCCRLTLSFHVGFFHCLLGDTGAIRPGF
jgi:hypothetical protein